MLNQNSKFFPNQLRNISDPPKQLFLVGEMTQIPEKCVSIVGTREPTEYGIKMAENITRRYVKMGYVIVSGLARGIDSVVHNTVLKESGTTIAVLAGNVHKPYPVSNSGLYKKIQQSGCVISEFGEDVCYEKYMFVRRNRIIAGLAEKVIVIEAPLHSGAMITAKYAIDYNRELLAVPGRITDKNSQGCNSLIKNNMAEIIFFESSDSVKQYGNKIFDDILNIIRCGIVNIDEIQSKVYMSKPELAKNLMFMEMDGLIAKDLFDRYIVLD